MAPCTKSATRTIVLRYNMTLLACRTQAACAVVPPARQRTLDRRRRTPENLHIGVHPTVHGSGTVVRPTVVGSSFEKMIVASACSMWAAHLQTNLDAVIPRLPFCLGDEIAGEIEHASARKFRSAQAHAVVAEGERHRGPVLDRLPSVESHMQKKRLLHLDEKVPVRRQDIEGRVRAPMPTASATV